VIAMPDWLVAVLCAVFAVHLGVFGRLAITRREPYYWLVTTVFLALTTSFGLRLLAPELAVAEIPLHRMMRYAAWALACVTIPLMIMRLRRRRGSSST
jgi:hypothetical protein